MKTRLSLVASFAAALMLSITGTAAAAPHFHATEAPQKLEGAQVNEQKFTSAPGAEVVCAAAATTGTISALEAEEQKVLVNYSSCNAFGFAKTTISTAHYDLFANGQVDIETPITITVEGVCVVTVGKQELTGSQVSYTNETSGVFKGIEEASNVKKISSEVTSGSKLLCKAGSEGTYIGNNFVHGAATNTLTWSNP